VPELPDILAYLTALEPRVVGRKLESVRLGSPFLLRSVAPPLSAAEGRRVVGLERIGKRINTERIDEALGTDPDTISTGCPYCMVMLGDAVSAKKSSGEAKETLEVIDVAQVLARSVRRPEAPAAAAAPEPEPAAD